MAIIYTEFYSDHDMQCPGSWYGGFKEGRVIRFGDGERALSHPWTGEWEGSQFAISISDYDRRFREQLASVNSRYWIEPITVRMTTRANRAALGTPYTVFVGPIIDIQLTGDLVMDLTLGDIVSASVLSNEHQIPWRVIRDGFIGELDAVSEALDLDAPEPIIYGEHRRVPDEDPASPQGFVYTPIYLGIEGLYHVWMVAGHACKAINNIYLDETPGSPGGLVSVLGAEGVDWFLPGYSEPAYEDRTSATYSNTRRYTLIRGLVGNADPDAVVLGEKDLLVAVSGIEDVGDGTGELITDRIQQYKHFCINYVANRGLESYQSGAWLANPTWDLFDGAVEIVDGDSFDACSAIGEYRLPIEGSPDYGAGYVGAAIIGARSADRSSVRRWIADWNRSCGVQFGITRLGQIRVVMLSPTEAIKAAAHLYTDAYEILRGSFTPEVRWGEKVTHVPFRADYEHTSGQWKTSDTLSIDGSLTLWQKEILGEMREYPFAPGITMANHLARLEALVRLHPPRFITLEATVGPDYNGDSLGYRDLGDYIRYRHFSGVNASRDEIRLAQVVRAQVQSGKRRVLIHAIDCEDLIDYDAPVTASPSPGS